MAIKGGIISFILLSLDLFIQVNFKKTGYSFLSYNLSFLFIGPNITKRKGKGGGGAESAEGEVWPRLNEINSKHKNKATYQLIS